ncbi:MAG: outer rane lipoproteinsorting protein [Hydrocarboniphaga sp.]|uniref:outer membrane lipoprotein-sorting protein n=1 Tax=Hydrocarboniphaga sp. TaxID=2033016 RepID=UPI0026376792|nr:outer membrane lipoprotein-sorting protein [Hydrocarboniphaga sp.]MDB5970516.1 outer rane lipoproteinsorting protein [Hydrocarboniphaga sp.]
MSHCDDRHRIFRHGLWSLPLMLCGPGTAQATEARDAAQVLSCMRSNSPTVLRTQNVTMEESRYTSVRAWLDQESCLPLKAEFYEGTRPLKRLIAPASSIRREGSIWYLQQIEMHDLQNDAYTTLSSEKGRASSAPAKLFDPTSFYKVD